MMKEQMWEHQTRLHRHRLADRGTLRRRLLSRHVDDEGPVISRQVSEKQPLLRELELQAGGQVQQ